MVSKLKSEIKQTADFVSLEEEANLNIVRTAEHLGSRIADLFKGFGLTATQYNALRILRGARPGGLACGEIGERMLTKESDITRLLDRLETRGLISRKRPANNRRTVITKITADGESLLAELDVPVAEFNRTAASRLGRDELETLIGLLEKLRDD